MLINIVLAVSAGFVALAEFVYKPTRNSQEWKLHWIKIFAALIVLVIGIHKAIEPTQARKRAAHYYEKGNFDQALTIYRKLELADPENKDLLRRIGSIYKRFAGQSREKVLAESFLEKSFGYYARLSVYDPHAIEPKISILSIFSMGHNKSKYTDYFKLLNAQIKKSGYLKGYDGAIISNKMLAELNKHLADYLIHAARDNEMGMMAVRALGMKPIERNKLFTLAYDYLEQARSLDNNNHGALIAQVQLASILSNIGNQLSRSNLDYLQNSMDLAIELRDKNPILHGKSGLSERLLLHVLNDKRIDSINAHNISIMGVVTSLEDKTDLLEKSNEDYLIEYTRNARYLFESYVSLGMLEKSSYWKSEVVKLKEYLTNRSRNRLCTQYGIACRL